MKLPTNLKNKDHFIFEYLVFCFAFVLLANHFLELYPINLSPWFFVTFLLIALLQGLKAIRLYVLLLWRWQGDYFPNYGKMLLVSLAFPFKLGEFYRIYKISTKVNSPLFSIVVVLLDRFFDTIPLVAIFVFSALIQKTSISIVIWIIISAFVFMLFGFIAFPSFYRYFNHYIIMTRPSKSKLWILKTLDLFQNIYLMAKSSVRDRVAILFVISIFTWGVEYLALLTLSQGINIIFDFSAFLTYLESAFLSQPNLLLSYYFSITSLFVLCLFPLFFLVKGVKKYEEVDRSL